MGIPLRELIEEHCGGVRGGWDNLKAVIPGGASVPLMPKSICDDVLMDFDSLQGRAVGPGHRRRDRDGQVHRPGQGDRAPGLFLQARELRPVHAVPRRHRLDVAGDGAHGQGRRRVAEIDLLLEVARQIEGHTICALGDAAAWPIQGLIRHFRPEIEAPHPRAHRKAGGGVGQRSRRCRKLKVDGVEVEFEPA